MQFALYFSLQHSTEYGPLLQADNPETSARWVQALSEAVLTVEKEAV